MDRAHANILLGIHKQEYISEDDLQDFFDEAVFKEVTFFMRRTFLPGLAKVRIRKLIEIDAAGKALDLGTNYQSAYSDMDFNLDKHSDLLSLLSAYHKNQAVIKTHLSNAAIPMQAVEIYYQWIRLHHLFSTRYITIFDSLMIDTGKKPDANIRISEEADFNQLYAELKLQKYNKLALYEYLRLKRLIA